MGGGSVSRIVGVFCAWALVHSLLASHRAKGLATKLVGRRYRNGLYRVAYNAQALVTVGAFAWWFLRLSDRELYRVRAPWSWPLYAGQLAALGVLLGTLRAVGFPRISGLAPLAQLLTGREPEPEPEARGPALGADGVLRVAGPFRFTRHPDNLPALGLWLFPRMTANRVTVAALATAYGLLGSLHEDHRLRQAYGTVFEGYQRRYPFCWPRINDRADGSESRRLH